MDVGAALREARCAAGWSQLELGQRSGVAAASISRYESGARRPSLAQLDRLLATCGKDLRLVVVERHDDLDATFAELAATPLAWRLTGGISCAWFVEQLARLPGRVHLEGPWAAQLAGLPTEQVPARVLVDDDDALLAELARTLWLRGQKVLGTRVSGVMASVAALRTDPTTEWEVADVGRLLVVRLGAGADRPPGLPLAVPGGVVDVTPPALLDPERDGVQPEVLARWRVWRSTTDVPPPVWRPPVQERG